MPPELEAALEKQANGESDAKVMRGCGIALEHHPMDSRIKISGQIVQTLNERMGTGGNNVPLVMRDEGIYSARGTE